jgi:hypothetical protein
VFYPLIFSYCAHVALNSGWRTAGSTRITVREPSYSGFEVQNIFHKTLLVIPYICLLYEQVPGSRLCRHNGQMFTRNANSNILKQCYLKK